MTKHAPLLVCVGGAILFALFLRAMVKSGNDDQRFLVSTYKFIVVMLIAMGLALLSIAHKWITGGF